MCLFDLEVFYPRMDVLVQEHQNILDLLKAGDRDGLLRAIKRHTQEAVEDLTATHQEKPSTSEDFSWPQAHDGHPV